MRNIRTGSLWAGPYIDHSSSPKCQVTKVLFLFDIHESHTISFHHTVKEMLRNLFIAPRFFISSSQVTFI